MSSIQFTPQPIVMHNMQRLYFLEFGEEPFGFGRVVAIPRQFGDKVPLADNETLTEGNMRLSLRQMPLQHRPVHAAR